MLKSIQNKVVLISGASSGIGKKIALQALKKGAFVSICARNHDALLAIEKEFNNANFFFVVADVSNENDCKNWIAESKKRFGKIDILINNAGISMRALFADADVSVIEEVMNINFWGTVYCTKHALPHIEAQNGTIVGISSIAGYKGLPARTGYSASKFAMQGFLEALRIEMIPKKVHVMWVSPGFTSSNIRNTALNNDGKAQQETPLDEKKLMSAEQCAAIIINAIEKQKRTVVMTFQGKLTVWLNKFFPAWVDKLVLKHFAKEANSPLK